MMVSILISTIDERIENVKEVLLPQRNDLEYIVSHQYTREAFKNIPRELRRSDITVSQIKGKGVSRSRNNAMKLAKGPICLLADDDVKYRENYIEVLKQAFRDNPNVDIALFKIKTKPGEPEYKNYPKYKVELKQRLFSVSTLEIAFNIDKVRNLGICFDERFGVGRKWLIGGEETIFIEDCLKQGSKMLFIPEYVVEHPYYSTIKSIPKYDKRRNWLTGGYDCRKNGKKALLKAFLGTLKIIPDLLKHKVSPATYLYHRLSAVIYILRTNKRANHSFGEENFKWKKN